MNHTVLLVGTRKGLWVGTSDEAREEWEFTGPHFDMEEVYSCLADTRSRPAAALRRRLVELAGAAGCAAPTTSARPGRRGRTAASGSPRAAARVWSGSGSWWPGREPETVWAGTEPGAVWRSSDGGHTFALEQQLWDHPQRPDWGAGFGGQAFHTILPHPDDADSVTVAISTGGVYQTTDGGGSWEPRNQGIRAEFLPEGQQYPTFGQCVHKVTRHPSRPERLFLQNHGGVYRSDDEGGVVDLHRRRAAGRLRVPGRGPPPRAGHRLRLPDQRRRPALPAGGQGAGVALPRRRRDAGRSWATGCPTTSSSASCATRCAPTTTPRPGSTSEPATAPSGRPPTPGRAGVRSSPTSRT